MPIRFRCPHCNQLMGIARRKAGHSVPCTACHATVTVPLTEDDAPVGTAPTDQEPALGGTVPAHAPAAPAGLFDRDDFDALLQGSGHPVRHPANSIPRERDRSQETGNPNRALPVSLSTTPTVALSPTFATMLLVVLILLLASAFALGLIVGRSGW